MAFALLMLKSRRIATKTNRLISEKRNALKVHKGEKPKYTVFQKCSHFIFDLIERLKKCAKKFCSFPKNSWLHRTSVKMRHDGTMENYILKSLVGFMGGFFLIYIFFLFFVIILNFSLSGATLLCTIFGSILTIGLAFSQRVRCIVFLILPQFFSKRGRQALIAYAFLLALTGPVKNTMNNMGILSESLACGQEQLKEAIRQIIDVIKKPFIAIKNAIKKVIEVVKKVVKKIKEVFLTIKRIVMGIVGVIKSAFQFLAKIFNICSKKVGTPFERCTKVFENSVVDCYAKLGPMFSWLCSIVYITQAVCYIVKPLDLICMLVEFIKSSVIGIIIKKIRIFIRHIRSTFYVRIHFSHSFEFETTQSKTMKEVGASILAEIRERTQKLNEMFNIISAATSLFFLVVILKALHYRFKFLTVDRFDNKYITKNFRLIDFRRAQIEKETVLPLNYRERKKYVDITSIRLVNNEKKKLTKTLGFLLSTSFKLGTQMAIDYCLYWLLSMIRYHGRYKNTIQAPQTVGVHVEGNGFLAELYRSIVRAFQPLGVKMDLDTIPCLPDPIPPNYDKYIQIAFILVLCFLLTIFEPYGLRFRNGIMCYYHPGRAKERAVWLYNHILRGRNSFLKFARRQLKRKFLGQDNITKITIREFLRAKINVKALRFILCLGPDKQEACVLCGEVFRPGDEVRPIRCSRPGCPGIYCERCFTDLQNLCTICLEPIQYGDISDVDEEKDSSEDENAAKFKRRMKKVAQKATGIQTDESDEEYIELKRTKKQSKFKRKINKHLRGGKDLLDSDYSSDNSDSTKSTEYSFSYQYSKSYEDSETFTNFFDVEKQYIPDYTSMEIFREENELKILTDSSVISSCKQRMIPVANLDSSSSSSLFNLKYYTPYSARTKVKMWLAEKTTYFKQKNTTEEIVPLLNLHQEECSESEEYYLKSSSEYSTELVTELEETFVNHDEANNIYESVNSDNSRMNYLFSDLRYETVDECILSNRSTFDCI